MSIKLTKIVPIYLAVYRGFVRILTRIYRQLHMNRHLLLAFLLVLTGQMTQAQKTPPAISVPTTIPKIKAALEESPNPILYTKQILQKRFRIDTIIVGKTRHFDGLADSLAYNGKEKKVYGPYGPPGGKFLVQLLSKAPNQFYHVGQIFIDTAIFRKRLADSIGNLILQKIRDGSATFEQLAQTYSMGGEAPLQGDLGWIARGLLAPTIEHEMLVHKKGDVFIVWTRAGLHVMKKLDDPKQDTGFALMLQVFL
jgi:peptidyl-prolyl cis-trans isomerase C